MRRVVITGIGPVHAVGTGVDVFARALDEMHRVARPMTERPLRGWVPKTDWYVPAPALDKGDEAWLGERLGPWAPETGRLAAVAARRALDDAGMTDPPSDACVMLGVGNSDLEDTVAVADMIGRGHRANVLRVSRIMPNAGASCVAIALDLHGAVQVISTACASGTDAIGHAFREIAVGAAEVSVCGGADVNHDSSDISMRYFDSLGVLTRCEDGLARPFSRHRSGFLFADAGACMLVLEELSRAEARGARIYGEITAYAANCDAFHVVRLPESNRFQKDIVSRLLERGPVQHISTHGTGTVANDRMEIAVIGELWPTPGSAPSVSATKALLGHTIGASGAFEAAVVARALRDGIMPGTPTDDVDGDIDVIRSTGPLDAESVVSVSFGFGGHNSGLRLERHGG